MDDPAGRRRAARLHVARDRADHQRRESVRCAHSPVSLAGSNARGFASRRTVRDTVDGIGGSQEEAHVASGLAVAKLHVACALALLLSACGSSSAEDEHLASVHVAGVRIDPVTSSPLVELVEEGERGRTLDIWVGEFEAESIARAIEHQPSPRPNSHDLLKSMLDQIHGRVRRTVVTELREGTYYAVIEVELRGRSLEIDARPSDAIAVALRAEAPVLVRDSLFKDADIPDDERALEIRFETPRESESPSRAPL
jgi:hypothetical protein